MAMNNPYAAYQKFALNPQTNQQQKLQNEQKEEKSNNNVRVMPTAYNQNKKQKTHQYLENAIMTATPEELTLMLYDGAIKFANKAIVYIEMNNIEEAHKSIMRVQDIFTELMSTLNMDYELSENLYSLYEFISHTMRQANIKKDMALIKEMIEMTRELRDAWAQAMKIAKKEMKR